MDGRKNNGGAGRGQGRKTKAEEEQVRNLCISAIVKKYGSEQQGIKALLDSGEASLIKFVYEHAYGKPTDNIKHSSDPDQPVYFKLDGRFTAQDS